MTQHRTREQQIENLACILHGQDMGVNRATATRYISEAEMRSTSALQAENERLREAALHLLETVHRPDLTKTEKVEATKRQLNARVLAATAPVGHTDREQLDWFEAALLRDVSLCSHMTAQGGISYSIGGDGIRFPSIRAAIDAAMDREGRGDA